jgi:hypothetical protein
MYLAKGAEKNVHNLIERKKALMDRGDKRAAKAINDLITGQMKSFNDSVRKAEGR